MLVIAGTALIAGGASSSSGAAFVGDIFALIGAIAVGVYVLIGRSLRTGCGRSHLLDCRLLRRRTRPLARRPLLWRPAVELLREDVVLAVRHNAGP
jgi:drug/metabolite transporter (DMT)-like permease